MPTVKDLKDLLANMDPLAYAVVRGGLWSRDIVRKCIKEGDFRIEMFADTDLDRILKEAEQLADTQGETFDECLIGNVTHMIGQELKYENQSKGWRILQKGEVIQAGDENLNDITKEWMPIRHSTGIKAEDPRYQFNAIFRRQGNLPQKVYQITGTMTWEMFKMMSVNHLCMIHKSGIVCTAIQDNANSRDIQLRRCLDSEIECLIPDMEGNKVLDVHADQLVACFDNRGNRILVQFLKGILLKQAIQPKEEVKNHD